MNKATSDRIYINDIWRVFGITGNAVMIEATSLLQALTWLKPEAVQYHEHERYFAEHLADFALARGKANKG